MKRLFAPAVNAVWLTAILFLCGGAGAAQEPATTIPPAIDEAYVARDDGTGRAGDAVNEFDPTDVPIHCVVVVGSAGKVMVKMNFVAVAVAGVKAETKVVTASYTTTDRQNRVNFTGRPDGKWTPGRYRVDIFLDGRPQKQLEFTIKGAGVVVPGASKFVPPQQRQKLKPKKPVN